MPQVKGLQGRKAPSRNHQKNRAAEAAATKEAAAREAAAKAEAEEPPAPAQAAQSAIDTSSRGTVSAIKAQLAGGIPMGGPRPAGHGLTRPRQHVEPPSATDSYGAGGASAHFQPAGTDVLQPEFQEVPLGAEPKPADETAPLLPKDGKAGETASSGCCCTIL